MDTLKNESEVYDSWKDQAETISSWFLMATPYPIVGIIVAYLLFVLKIGPNFMKNRRPFVLRNVILIYNIFQVVCAAYMVYIGCKEINRHGVVPSRCEMDKRAVISITTGTYFYFLTKASELLDTVFFVLRKKDSQITFLHVYHHFIIVTATWWTLKYEPSYTPVFLGTINSFVHIVMYSYYALSTFPALAKYLWWKKYITKLQLGQFVLIIIQMIVNYKIGCPPSIFLFGIMFFNLGLMIYLFSAFYVKAYSKGRKEKADSEKNKAAKAKIELNNNSYNNKNGKVHQKVHKRLNVY